MVPISHIEGRVTIRLLRTGSPVFRSPVGQYGSVVCLPDLLTGALRHVDGFPVLGLLWRLCLLPPLLVRYHSRRQAIIRCRIGYPSCRAFRRRLYTGDSWGGVMLSFTTHYLPVWFRLSGVSSERVHH